jgi:hypothetical protein
MTHIITAVARVALPEWPELELESTERTVHLSPRTSGRVYAIRGVASLAAKQARFPAVSEHTVLASSMARHIEDWMGGRQ